MERLSILTRNHTTNHTATHLNVVLKNALEDFLQIAYFKSPVSDIFSFNFPQPWLIEIVWGSGNNKISKKHKLLLCKTLDKDMSVNKYLSKNPD